MYKYYLGVLKDKDGIPQSKNAQENMRSLNWRDSDLRDLNVGLKN